MIKHYENDEIIVTWKPDVCIHSGNCFRKLTSVFDPRRKPWIIMENGSTQEIIETIGVCPSGAISHQLKNKEMAEQNESINSAPIILVSNAGPLLIKSGCIIEDVHGNQTVKEGVVALCRCGASSNKPYCDGTHRKTGFTG